MLRPIWPNDVGIRPDQGWKMCTIFCSRPSWPRRNARLCDSDLPDRASQDPSIARPDFACTGPPPRLETGLSSGSEEADADGAADADADGDAGGDVVADGIAQTGLVVGGFSTGAATGVAAGREQAAGSAARAARVRTPRRASRGASLIRTSSQVSRADVTTL